MNDILDMLQKADGGPNQEIDGAIAKYLGWTHQKMKGDAKAYWRKPGDGSYYMRQKNGPPEYTNSIDVAVSLIPPGMFWVLSFGKTRKEEPLGGCQIFQGGDIDDVGDPLSEGEGNSVHIAICIAALKLLDVNSVVAA